MVRITEHNEGDLSYATFLEQRQRERKSAARDLQRLRDERRILEAEIAESQLAAEREMAGAGAVSERIARAARGRLGVATKLLEDQDPELARIDREIARIKLIYGRADRRTVLDAARDQLDFKHLAVDGRADAADPVLVGIPGTRAFRQDGWTVYRRSSHGHELLRASADEIVVRSSDGYAIRAAVALASRRHEPPLLLDGSPRFVEQAAQAARDLGVSFVLPGTQEIVRPDKAAPAPSATRSTTTISPEPGSTSSTAGAAFPLDKLEQVKSAVGVAYAAEIDKTGLPRQFFVHSRTEIFGTDRGSVYVLQPEPGANACVVAALHGDAIEPGTWVEVAAEGRGFSATPVRRKIEATDERLRVLAAELGAVSVEPLDGDWLELDQPLKVHALSQAFKPEHPKAVVLHSLEAERYFVAVFPDVGAIKVGDDLTVAWDEVAQTYTFAPYDPLAPSPGRDDDGHDPPGDEREREPKGRQR